MSISIRYQWCIISQIYRHKSCIKFFCIYSWMQAPDRREIYYPPQIIYGLDGDQSVLFGTGGSERSGALYVISMTDLLERDVSRVCVFCNCLYLYSIYWNMIPKMESANCNQTNKLNSLIFRRFQFTEMIKEECSHPRR